MKWEEEAAGRIDFWRRRSPWDEPDLDMERRGVQRDFGIDLMVMTMGGTRHWYFFDRECVRCI